MQKYILYEKKQNFLSTYKVLYDREFFTFIASLC